MRMEIKKTKIEHKCAGNYHNKSSKGMKCDAAVAMAVSIHDKFKGKAFIANFVSDDDASTRNLLTNGPKNPHLPDSFPTPTFLADLNHRIKCIAKPKIGLAATNKGISRVSRGDTLRIKRNYTW